MTSAAVMWHDVECGHYEADLELWEELAAAGPVLDVGAGTGRVALRLAQAGHAVETVVADAADFDLAGREFALVAVPMQTIQLLPGATARAGFFASARRALRPGGLVALALADTPEAFEDPSELPLPDIGEHHGRRYVSQPVAIRLREDAVRIERLRQVVSPDGTRTSEEDVVELAALSAGQLADEAAPYDLRPEPSRIVPATDDHVGSEVVMLRG
jgi:SAM-dependent methyltransferase